MKSLFIYGYAIFSFFLADSGILCVDWFIGFVFVDIGKHGVDDFYPLLAFFHASYDGNGTLADCV